MRCGLFPRIVATMGIAPIGLILSSPLSSGGTAVAVVSEIEGDGTVAAAPGAAAVALRRFDWLGSGARIATGPDARLTVVFGDGTRYAMRGSAGATVTDDGLINRSGTIDELSPIAPFPSLPGIAATKRRVERAAAVRLRTGSDDSVRHMYPAGAAASLPYATVLEFQPVAGAMSYHVELEDEAGGVVFEMHTQSTRVPVPEGRLKPGAEYYWRVSAMGALREIGHGEAEFETVGGAEIRQRTILKESLERTPGSESTALLAAVDRRLGLLAEARDGFRQALRLAPESSTLEQALNSIEEEIRKLP